MVRSPVKVMTLAEFFLNAIAKILDQIAVNLPIDRLI
jgi:hypothetical protein